MRALAVIMMVQGHTVHTLLAPEYRTFESVFYTVWHTMRGFTAPIFMFTAGVAFTYLFKLNNKRFEENPRVKKGLKRFALLVFIGYLLRYPTWRLIDFSNVTEQQWITFFTVDALHLIGFGLLAIISIFFVTSKLNMNYEKAVLPVTILLILISPLIVNYDWLQIFPLWLADYFTNQYGSFFPLFPWLAYVLSGSLLGNYLAKNKGVQREFKFIIKLSVIGLVLLLFSFLFSTILPDELISRKYLSNINIVLIRLGTVILLNALIAFLVLEVKRIPNIILLLGRNTLLIYAVHLVILYGSAWSPGLHYFVGESFSLSQTLFSVAIMFLFIILLVTFMDKARIIKKKVLLLVGA